MRIETKIGLLRCAVNTAEDKQQVELKGFNVEHTTTAISHWPPIFIRGSNRPD
jgi:hypothetical protein